MISAVYMGLERVIQSYVQAIYTSGSDTSRSQLLSFFFVCSRALIRPYCPRKHRMLSLELGTALL